MFLVGLTGGIATGKSTVCLMFEELGVPIIDTDKMARIVVEPGRKAWRKICEEFGPSVVEADGQINRVALGQIIFSNPQKRKLLNEITHPEIAKEVGTRVLQLLVQGYHFVIIDSPLLFEANTWLKLVHKVIVVSCDDDVELRRLMNRDGLTEEAALVRINAQMPLEEKRSRADYLIHNNGTVQETREQVFKIHHELISLNTYWFVRFGILGAATVLISSIYGVFRLLR